MSSRRYVGVSFLLFGVLVLMLTKGPARARDAGNLSDNVLINGNFDELPFYGEIYPSSYIAGGWYRWWIHGTVVPEFDDVNKPDGVRRDIYVDGGHAQVYFKYGPTYTAGIYQVVEGLTPCRPYELTMHARNHSLPGVHPHARIGLDPFGADLTSGATLDERGAVFDTAPLDRAVWSREQTDLFVWEELSVTTEPRGHKLTVILYASPEPSIDADHYYDTFWDAGALIPTTYEGGRLPAPTQPTTDFISSVRAVTHTDSLAISWDVSAPATSQVWYSVATPDVVSPTVPLSYTAYLPLINSFTLDYDHETPLDFNDGLSHTVTIPDLLPGQVVNWIVLARRLEGNTCVTEYAGPYQVRID